MGDGFWQTINYFRNDVIDQFINKNIIVGDKVYNKADQIHLGTKQIFLKFKRKLHPIYSLLTDVYGIFTPLKDILLMRGL
ncbi:hypothetical protein DB44_ER00410 [Candidatus Protochlamydia amoebophila]|uniref:Uncharacterized protein n=1 Tax=Candidatus Protochlamydia amoebophila TaxID=362787 RepID=A0A0C1JV49_9BACT|nr:hypothetical protein DB44_ER00410 [Candidatus Protochlamydia amoebophila]